MTEVWTKRGGKRIELFIPVKCNDIEINEIEIGPVTLGHVVRWGEGKYSGNYMGLLAELAGRSLEEIQAVAYPDIERVLAAFLSMLPDTIRSTLTTPPQQRIAAPDEIAEPAGEVRFARPTPAPLHDDEMSSGLDERLTER